MLKRIAKCLIYDILIILLGIGLTFMAHKAAIDQAASASLALVRVNTYLQFGCLILFTFISFLIYNSDRPVKFLDKLVEFILVTLPVGAILVFYIVPDLLSKLLGTKALEYVYAYYSSIPVSFYIIGLCESLCRILLRNGPKPPKPPKPQ